MSGQGDSSGSETRDRIEKSLAPAQNKADSTTSSSALFNTGFIAAVTLVSYILVFMYEVGFCAHFGIPMELVSVSMTRLLSVIGPIIILIYSLLMALENIGPYLIKWLVRRPSYVVHVMVLLGYSLSFVPAMILFREHFGYWVPLTVPFVFYLLLIVVTPRFINAAVKRSVEKNAVSATNQQEPEALFFKLFRVRGSTILAIILLMFVCSFSRMVGQSDALREENFSIVKAAPECAVLRFYGDKAICYKLNRKSKTVAKTFKVLKVGEQGVEYSMEKVGPLKLVSE
ncbi:MAG: hypothetical protein HY914_06845 [Desulfomonile tiedjei]|nr:hypothetical protein [Desulfomonile tiedjei]